MVRVVHRTQYRRVLAVSGTVDRDAIEDLREACRPDRVPEGTTLVIDFTAMTGCPSALLLVLLRINRDLGTSRHFRLDGLDEALVAIASGHHPAEQAGERDTLVHHLEPAPRTGGARRRRATTSR